MKVTMRIESDSYNSFSTETIELSAASHTSCILLSLGDREVSVNKKDFLNTVKFLCENDEKE